MNCALIGTSKFSEVHLEELVKIGIKQITIISRDKNKRNDLCNKYRSKFPNVKIDNSNIRILKQKKFDLIDICTSNDVHDKYLRYVSKMKSIILVEKPIISLIKLKKKYKEFLNKIYKENKKLIVCYPMQYLCKDVKKNFKVKDRINIFKFDFTTGGRYKKKEICIDLMPHVLSFLFTFFSQNKFKKNVKIIKTKVKKNSWFSKFAVKKVAFFINLKEKKSSKTSLSISINNKKISRFTKTQNKKFINFLRYKKKIKKIKNPMSEFFKNLIKNKNNSKYYLKNKKLTYSLMDFNYRLLQS